MNAKTIRYTSLFLASITACAVSIPIQAKGSKAASLIEWTIALNRAESELIKVHADITKKKTLIFSANYINTEKNIAQSLETKQLTLGKYGLQVTVEDKLNGDEIIIAITKTEDGYPKITEVRLINKFTSDEKQLTEQTKKTKTEFNHGDQCIIA